MISDAGLINDKELKKLAGDREKWREYGKLQNQPEYREKRRVFTIP